MVDSSLLILAVILFPLLNMQDQVGRQVRLLPMVL